jgi:hypothetical protein
MDSLKSITQKRDDYHNEDYEESLDRIEEDLEDEGSPTNSPKLASSKASAMSLDKIARKATI